MVTNPFLMLMPDYQHHSKRKQLSDDNPDYLHFVSACCGYNMKYVPDAMLCAIAHSMNIKVIYVSGCLLLFISFPCLF